MFIILLRFSNNKASAPAHMAGHNAWLAQGFEDGVFNLAGSLMPGIGGGILATAQSLAEVEDRVAKDPFVTEDVVKAEILELKPARADAHMAFAMEATA